MPPLRHFLDWIRPPPDAVADWLWARRAEGALPDLREWLVLVPTRQAGRRLRARLAALADEQGRALLPPLVQTPPVFWSSRAEEARTAGPLLESAIWQQLLEQAPASLLAPLFPAWKSGVPGGQTRGVANLFQQLRRTLAEAGLTLGTAAPRIDVAPEAERWRALAGLESLYEETLSRLGMEDSSAREIRLANQPELPPGIRRVALAALPDPSPLLLHALERLGGRADIHALVVAPEALADRFDEWGRPRAEAWTRAEIDLPDEERTLHLAADLPDQADRAIALLMGAPEAAALGVPDASLLPHLAQSLETRGLRLRDTAGAAVSNHPIGRLLRLLADAAEEPGYAELRDLVRHADVLAALARACACPPGRLLTALDRLQNAHLPRRWADVARVASTSPHLAGEERAALDAALRHLDGWRARLNDAPPAEALPGLLAEVFAGRELDPARPDDALFQAVAESLRPLLDDLRRPIWAALGLSSARQLKLLLEQWEGARVPTGPGPDTVDAEGWLELAWHPAPVLVITGMQEGSVPGGGVADPFLPDSARLALGLRSDTTRLARDAYLLASLVESRRARGRAHLLCSRTGRDNDPLKPSRLLFLCPDAHLPHRARRLFTATDTTATREPATLPFRLDLTPPPAAPAAEFRLSVSDFKAYLACPFVYFLQRVLRVGEPLADDARELDARGFGDLAHECLRAFGNNPEMAASGKAGAIAAFLEDELAARVRARYGSRPSLAIVFQQASLRQRFAAFAARQAEEARAGWRVEAVELPVRMRVGGALVTGKIDRIDRGPDGAVLRVLDYKTSEKPTPPRDAHARPGRGRGGPGRFTPPDGTKPEVWTDLQLPLYAAMVAALRDHPVQAIQVGYAQLPAAVGETAIETWPGFGPRWVDEAVACAGRVEAAIRARHFLDFTGYPKGEHDPYALLFGGDPEGAIDEAALRAWGATRPPEEAP